MRKYKMSAEIRSFSNSSNSNSSTPPDSSKGPNSPKDNPIVEDKIDAVVPSNARSLFNDNSSKSNNAAENQANTDIPSEGFWGNHFDPNVGHTSDFNENYRIPFIALGIILLGAAIYKSDHKKISFKGEYCLAVTGAGSLLTGVTKKDGYFFLTLALCSPFIFSSALNRWKWKNQSV
jgi:hypothetical protein